MILAKYYAGDQMEKNELAGHVACMGERRGEYRVLVGTTYHKALYCVVFSTPLLPRPS